MAGMRLLEPKGQLLKGCGGCDRGLRPLQGVAEQCQVCKRTLEAWASELTGNR